MKKMSRSTLIREFRVGSPKLNFGGYMTFESTFKALKPDNFAFYLMKIESLTGLVPGFVLYPFCF